MITALLIFYQRLGCSITTLWSQMERSSA